MKFPSLVDVAQRVRQEEQVRGASLEPVRGHGDRSKNPKQNLSDRAAHLLALGFKPSRIAVHLSVPEKEVRQLLGLPPRGAR